ncbi:hypothetical protein Q0M53_13875, partial [Staphylococcus aureus]|nr:hypothetical protein [Staphylococcus aureus]
MLGGSGIAPQELLHFFAGQLQKESTELNLRLITGYISGIYWGFLPKSTRNKESEGLENIVWNALQKQTAVNN